MSLVSSSSRRDPALLSHRPARAEPDAPATPQADAAAYRNLSLSFEARAADLVSRMTGDEKISQLMNDAAAIPRLDVPAYDWWNECLHGVARAGAATVFPQAIGMAASFDTALMHDVAVAISDEARAKHHEFLRRGERARYQGLTFWSPNINIFRDPRWGRGQETYGEDPFLTARMGVAFVKGLQGDRPALSEGGGDRETLRRPQRTRGRPSPLRRAAIGARPVRDLPPAFRALVQEARVASVMSAYNRVHGESASASTRLLGDILRRDWGFKGYVVSDCGAIDDIYRTHKIVSTPEDAAALGVQRGCDLECGTTYRALKKALAEGRITEQAIDVAVTRLMLTRFRLGMFDPPERVPYAQIPYSVNQSPEHDALARRMAQATIVLLKNDGVLPLSRAALKTLAVIGPNADDVMTLLGNYYGTPARPVTLADRNPQRCRSGHAGAVRAGGRSRRRPAGSPFHAGGRRGVSEARRRRQRTGASAASTSVGANCRASRCCRASTGPWSSAGTAAPDDRSRRTRRTGRRARARQRRLLGAMDGPDRAAHVGTLRACSHRRRWRQAGSGWAACDRRLGRRRRAQRPGPRRVDLEAGRPYDLRLEYFEGGVTRRCASRGNGPEPRHRSRRQLDAARAADVVLFAGGLTGDVEGEEMPVSYAGFAGGDRTDIALPQSQQALLQDAARDRQAGRRDPDGRHLRWASSGPSSTCPPSSWRGIRASRVAQPSQISSSAT